LIYKDENPRALLTCGHAFGSESMLYLLRNTIKKKDYVIKCPGIGINKNICNAELSFSLCCKIAVMTKFEK